MTVVVDRPTLPVIDTSAPVLPPPPGWPPHRSAGRPSPGRDARIETAPRAPTSPRCSSTSRWRPSRSSARPRGCVVSTRPSPPRPPRSARSCPLLTACLYRAVVDYDVAGFVAGTTQRQRGEIRARLGVEVEAEDFDSLAGVVGGQRSVDHDEVVRLRRTHPDESLERIARRLGCSLSTVKRHLRRERNEPAAVDGRGTTRPTETAVRRVTAEILAENSGSRRAAA